MLVSGVPGKLSEPARSSLIRSSATAWRPWQVESGDLLAGFEVDHADHPAVAVKGERRGSTGGAHQIADPIVAGLEPDGLGEGAADRVDDVDAALPGARDEKAAAAAVENKVAGRGQVLNPMAEAPVFYADQRNDARAGIGDGEPRTFPVELDLLRLEIEIEDAAYAHRVQVEKDEPPRFEKACDQKPLGAGKNEVVRRRPDIDPLDHPIQPCVDDRDLPCGPVGDKDMAVQLVGPDRQGRDPRRHLQDQDEADNGECRRPVAPDAPAGNKRQEAPPRQEAGSGKAFRGACSRGGIRR